MVTSSKLKIFTRLLTFLLISIQQGFGQNLDYLPKGSFYKSYKKHSVEKGTAAHLPIKPDREVFKDFFYKGRENALHPLLDAMNSYLDSLGLTMAIHDSINMKGSPYVFVGSSDAETAPPGAEMMRQEHDKFPPMLIYIKKPSQQWREQVSASLPPDLNYALAIWLSFSEYPKANKGIFGKKVVLGTNYERDIRFLSAEDRPVEVLQVTGMLLNREGDILRAGAEGIIHEDTPFWAQVLELKKSIDNKAICDVISNYRREDLPGKPLAWQQALDNLVENLLYGSKRKIQLSLE